ncbi:hypothetical protein [Paenibacillus gansuensis]|uniref:Uncharacterized protein n=1 Tax=Paenibacillus gansuensis TaxID=306542 RepID=A0ABW5PFW5_9BACL
MSALEQILDITTRYEMMEQEVEQRTGELFGRLRAIYEEQLQAATRTNPKAVEIAAQAGESRFDFRIKHNSYTLFIVDGVHFVKKPDQINDTLGAADSPIQEIVEDADAQKYLAGCIALTMRIQNQYVTLLRIFVNCSGGVSYELGIGRKRKLEFLEPEQKNNLQELLFHEPIRESLLNPTTCWKPLEDIQFVDSIRDLTSDNEQIGFVQPEE